MNNALRKDLNIIQNDSSNSWFSQHFQIVFDELNGFIERDLRKKRFLKTLMANIWSRFYFTSNVDLIS